MTTVLDADRGELTEALRTFTRESAGADVSLVFYAGHGLEVDGVNYLVPVDARLERDTDVRFETVELDYVLAATTGAALRVVILDACRNNPLARSMQRTGATRSVSRGSFGNLDESLLGDETLVAYAAAAGTTAADGARAEQSVHVGAAVVYGAAAGDRAAVSGGTGAGAGGDGGRAAPARVCGSLLGEHYLRAAVGADPRAVEAGLGLDRASTSPDPGGSDAGGLLGGPCGRGVRSGDARGAPGLAEVAGCDGDVVSGRGGRRRRWGLRWPARRRWRAGAPTATVAAAVASAAPTATVAAAAPAATASAPTTELTGQRRSSWESMRDSTNASDFEAYLGRWPSGIYAPLATNRLAALREAASAPPAVDPARPREAGEVFARLPDVPGTGGDSPRVTFLMGSGSAGDDESDDDERPRPRVTVGSFALGTCTSDAGRVCGVRGGDGPRLRQPVLGHERR